MPDEPDASGAPEPRVVDNHDAHRYEIYVGDTRAGFATYRWQNGQLVVVHTEIAPEFEHHGLASRLAQAVLDDVRRRGLRVVPECPFLKRYLRGHAAYQDLVA